MKAEKQWPPPPTCFLKGGSGGFRKWYTRLLRRSPQLGCLKDEIGRRQHQCKFLETQTIPWLCHCWCDIAISQIECCPWKAAPDAAKGYVEQYWEREVKLQ